MIVTALPTALAGIVWILIATGTTLSVPALMGAIMCMGVATANSILVISFARERMAAGADALTAALEAGGTRFRPVLMTALAMIIGMLPMAIEPKRILLLVADGRERACLATRARQEEVRLQVLSVLPDMPFDPEPYIPFGRYSLLERWPRCWGANNLFRTATVGNDSSQRRVSQLRASRSGALPAKNSSNRLALLQLIVLCAGSSRGSQT